MKAEGCQGYSVCLSQESDPHQTRSAAYPSFNAGSQSGRQAHGEADAQAWGLET